MITVAINGETEHVIIYDRATGNRIEIPFKDWNWMVDHIGTRTPSEDKDNPP